VTTGSLPPPAAAAQVRAALRAAARSGPFFDLVVRDQASGWRPAAEQYRDGIPGLIASTARQLGTGEQRVAASIVHQGLAARIWSPVLHCGLVSGVVPDLSTLTMTTSPQLRLGVAEPAGWTVSDLAELTAVSGEVARAQLRLLAAALPVRLAAGLLRGNAASAMIGALGVLTSARPELAGRAGQLAPALLRTSDLRQAGTLSDTEPMAFRRRSCCLYYRVPGGGLCGDCCFRRPPGPASAG
jgi:hypothetical protein